MDSSSLTGDNSLKLNFDTENDSSTQQMPKLYKRRWIILILFIFSTANSIMQWIQYFIIANVVVKFYDIPFTDVNKTYTAYLLLYVIFLFPSIYLLEKIGLRWSILLGMVGTAAAAWIKVASAVPDRFWLLFLGQCIAASFQVIMQSMPLKLVAAWFGANELSKACSAAFVGNQIGEAFGMILPPLFVNDQQTFEEMQNGFEIIAYFNAGVATVILILLLILFQEKPPTPPSCAEIKITLTKNNLNLWQSGKILFKNVPYLFLLTAGTLNISVYILLLTMLSQMVLHHYPNASYDAGVMGLLMVLMGIISSIGTGVILDKFRQYKITALVALIVSFVALASFDFLAPQGIGVVYVLIVIMGSSLRSFMITAFESSAEVTYPAPVSISSGILITVPQAFDIPFTYLYSYLFYDVGATYANLTMAFFILVSIFIVACTRLNLKRHAAQM